MTDADGPIIQDPEGLNLLKLVSLKRLLVIVRALAAAAIVLHLVYFVAASIVHHNGPGAATYRLGTTAYAIATDLVLSGWPISLTFSRRNRRSANAPFYIFYNPTEETKWLTQMAQKTQILRQGANGKV